MNITTAFNQRNFLVPRADFTTESHRELINLILIRHGEVKEGIYEVKLIDDNDDYDSFYAFTSKGSFCIKVSFDKEVLLYEYTILKGLESLSVAPRVFGMSEIEFGDTVYYTIQSYEHSDNLYELGQSIILDEKYNHFNEALSLFHKTVPPEEIHDYFDTFETYLKYQKLNFESLLKYVDKGEEEVFEFIKTVYNNTYNEMIEIYEKNKNSLSLNFLVHGNLDLSTIIENSYFFKFINFENCFLGSPLFDIANLVFELQMNGLNEYDFVSKRIHMMSLTENRFKIANYVNEYKICKILCVRKKFLTFLKEYLKEVVIYNNQRIDKMAKLGHEFSNSFYRFDEISEFKKHKDLFVSKFSALILDDN